MVLLLAEAPPLPIVLCSNVTTPGFVNYSRPTSFPLLIRMG